MTLSHLLLCSVVFWGPQPHEGETMKPQLSLTWKLLENNHADSEKSLSELTISHRDGHPLPASGWNLYFNFVRPVEAKDPEGPLTVKHINGDFHVITPQAGFQGLASGGSFTLKMISSYWVIKYSDAPAGFYLVFDGEPNHFVDVPVVTTPIEDPKQTTRKDGDNLAVPTPNSSFAKNEEVSLLSGKDVPPIVPTPTSLTYEHGQYALGETITVTADKGLDSELNYLGNFLHRWHGRNLKVDTNGALQLSLGTVKVDGRVVKKEAYELVVDNTGVRITGSDPAGVFYGIQSFLALLAGNGSNIPTLRITDAPRFGYRGMHLDVARNFLPAEQVKKLIDLMALYKLNRFHFHLTDDEGWRLEIPGLPELTQVGGMRAHDLSERTAILPAYGSGPRPVGHGSGYYDRATFVDILRYAKERHVQVIPEIDVPGHARAAIKAMASRAERLREEGKQAEADKYLLHDVADKSEYRSVQFFDDNVLNPCRENTFIFLEKVLDETRAMFADAGAPLETVHLGGDEVPKGVWTNSPDCGTFAAENPELNNPMALNDYFWTRMSDMLAKRGLVLGGWEEVALHHTKEGKQPNPHFIGKNVMAYLWDNVIGWGAEDLAYRLANAGYPVVMSGVTNLYFDMAYDKDPNEPGFYWGGFVDTRKPWAFIPLDLLRSADMDQMGNPVDLTKMSDKVKLTEEGRERIVGIQGQLWSETVLSSERMDYMAFPKLLGLAERAWAADPEWANVPDPQGRKAAASKAWNRFANALGQREFGRLDTLFGGTQWRIPPAGAIAKDGKLHANNPYPGLEIRYTTDGSKPTTKSPLYTGPVAVEGNVRIGVFAPNGRASRTVEIKVEQPAL